MQTVTSNPFVNIHNTVYNIGSAANGYASTQRNLSSAIAKPRKSQYRSVNQLLKESPLVGSTKLGLNFIA